MYDGEGVVKTQLAAHYARRAWNASEVDLLVWVTATNRDAIHTTYAHAAALKELLADLLRVLGPDHPGTLAIRSSLAHWRAMQRISLGKRKMSGKNRPS